MTYSAPLRTRKAVLLAAVETTPGVDAAPTVANAIYCEVTSNPVVPTADKIATNYVSGALDTGNSLIAGIKATLTVTIPLMSPQPPGVVPDFDVLMQGCAMLGTANKTDYSASTLSITGGNTLADTGNGLAAFTAGTEITVIGEATNGTFNALVAGSAAGSLSLTKIDGTALSLANVAAGEALTIRRGVAGTAATAGTTTSAALGAPFAATAETYRHWPLLVSGNPATPQYSVVQDYTAGQVATLTDTFAAALSASSILSAPANLVYVPTSAAAAIKNLTLYLYVDGVLWKMYGAVGDWSLDCTGAGVSRMTFKFQGVFGGRFDAALPAYLPPTGVTPPVFRGGYSLLGRLPAAVKKLSIASGNTVVFPPNPNAAKGFDPPIITSRKFTGSIDPQAGLSLTDQTMALFTTSTSAMINGRFGTSPGNRFSLTVPSAFILAANPADDGGLQRTTVNFECQNNNDAAFGLAIY